MIKHILIDLDGTLTDPKVGITTSARYGLEKIGYPIDENQNIDWIIGPPLKDSLAKLLPAEASSELAGQALEAYRERFSVIGLFENQLYPTVAETLARLQQGQYQLYLATAKPTIYARKILEYFNLDQYFTQIYGSELTGERSHKADLIGYILQQERLLASECVMIGDREYDILGARAHGIPTIAVTYGYGTAEELKKAQPWQYVAQFSQISTYL